MRKKPNLIPRMERCARLLIDTAENPFPRRGHWRELMPEATALHLELGCGKGLYIAATAPKRPDINFIGNVESNRVPFDACDILVTDGFTGNVLLKTMEGMGKMFSARMKGIFYKSLLTKLGALTVKKPFMEFKKDFDVKEHGGSPILGIRKPVIKAHGSSDARAFKSAIRQAMRFAESGAIESLERQLGTDTPVGKE